MSAPTSFRYAEIAAAVRGYNYECTAFGDSPWCCYVTSPRLATSVVAIIFGRGELRATWGETVVTARHPTALMALLPVKKSEEESRVIARKSAPIKYQKRPPKEE